MDSLVERPCSCITQGPEKFAEVARVKGAPIAEDIWFSTPLTPSALAQSNQQRMGNFLRGRNKASRSRDIEPRGKMHVDREPIIVIAI